MNVLEGDFNRWVPPEGGAAITIGVYDGVHLGHQSVLERLRRRAGELGGLPIAVLTFDRHPLTVIAPDRAPRLLTTLAQKLDVFAALGVDTTAVLRFDDDVRRLGAEDFAADVLVGALGASVVAVGTDFRFGHGRAGDVSTLRDLGLGLGYYVEEIPLLDDEGPVSSTSIRDAVAEGDVMRAAALLGRPFAMRGVVVEGDRRGRRIGFPTANIVPSPELVIPARGVYAALVDIGDGDARAAVVNVGVRPTFGTGALVVEAHLLDADIDLYGVEIEIHFRARLREERTFAGVDELTDQIRRDVDRGRRLLAPS